MTPRVLWLEKLGRKLPKNLPPWVGTVTKCVIAIGISSLGWGIVAYAGLAPFSAALITSILGFLYGALYLWYRPIRTAEFVIFSWGVIFGLWSFYSTELGRLVSGLWLTSYVAGAALGSIKVPFRKGTIRGLVVAARVASAGVVVTAGIWLSATSPTGLTTNVFITAGAGLIAGFLIFYLKIFKGWVLFGGILTAFAVYITLVVLRESTDRVQQMWMLSVLGGAIIGEYLKHIKEPLSTKEPTYRGG